MGRLTDERLRRWLNGNQPARERLCLALLRLDRNYSDLRPRRPEGGPDGARDIEGVYRGQLPFWGAVGFVNSATDSAEEKRQIRAKFMSDLDSALAKNSALKAFVFCTNIDLTPHESEELAALGTARGISLVEIYYRERLRILLDSPEGLGTRFEYLDVTLSRAEQAAFFSRFGPDLEGLVKSSYADVASRIDRLEYLTLYANEAIERFLLDLELRRSMTIGDLGGYFVAAGFHRFGAEDKKSLSLRGLGPATMSAGIGHDGKKYRWCGTSTELKEVAFDVDRQSWVEKPIKKGLLPFRDNAITRLQMGFEHDFDVGFTPRSLDGLAVRVHLDEHLSQNVASVQVVVNRHVLLRFPWTVKDAEHTCAAQFEWPRPLHRRERSRVLVSAHTYVSAPIIDFVAIRPQLHSWRRTVGGGAEPGG